MEALQERLERLGCAMAPLNLEPESHALDRLVDAPMTTNQSLSDSAPFVRTASLLVSRGNPG